MWKEAGTWVAGAILIAIAIAAGFLMIVVIRLLPFIMALLVLAKLCDLVVHRFGWKQREWKDSVKAPLWTIRWTAIRRRPTSRWVWTIGLFVFLFFILSGENAMVLSLDPEQLGLFWPMLILFSCSCWSLFVKAVAWRDFGETYFIPDLSFSPGGKVAGRIYFQRKGPIRYDVVSRVECIQILNEGDTSSRTIRWSSERKISPREFGVGAAGRYIPIDFDLPCSVLGCFSNRHGLQILWQLRIKSAHPRLGRSDGKFRVPYEDCFGIPVVWRPDLLRADMILRETNAEIQRFMIERYGQDRFVLDAKARILDQWKDNELLSIDLPEDPDRRLVALKLRCPSTAAVYILRVPPGQRTVKGALAWSFGLDRPEDYVLEQES